MSNVEMFRERAHRRDCHQKSSIIMNRNRHSGGKCARLKSVAFGAATCSSAQEPKIAPDKQRM
jgi:hypothetical protein